MDFERESGDEQVGVSQVQGGRRNEVSTVLMSEILKN